MQAHEHRNWANLLSLIILIPLILLWKYNSYKHKMEQPAQASTPNPIPCDVSPAPLSSTEPPQLKLPNVRAQELNYDFAALNAAYDAVIDIHSIQHAKLGWGICGKSWEHLSQIFARLVGVVGDFKDGKTFVISLLAQRTLPHNATKHTPGLCLTLSRLPSTPQHNPSPSSGKPMHHMKMRAQEGMELLQDCYIDTEGTDQPVTGINTNLFFTIPICLPLSYITVAEGASQDIRATEFLLRTLVVELASRVLYVTKKWGYNTQTKVNNLIKLINSMQQRTSQITPSNSLIIVHNHPEVLNVAGLAPWIEVIVTSF